MSNEGPKLFSNKPKKSKLKPVAPSPMASSSTATAAAPPPPPPVKESFARRYRFMWPLLLAVNFTVGAYLFMRTKKKDTGVEEAEVPTTSELPSPVATITEKPVITIAETPVITTPPPIVEHVPRAPVPEDQQRELYKWLLEEKRKEKPKDFEEKKRIDEEKYILKQFIRAKSIPNL